MRIIKEIIDSCGAYTYDRAILDAVWPQLQFGITTMILFKKPRADAESRERNLIVYYTFVFILQFQDITAKLARRFAVSTQLQRHETTEQCICIPAKHYLIYRTKL